MLDDNLAAVRASYEAFSRGDLDGATAMMDDSIVWHQAEGLPHGGIYEGLPAVRASVFDPLDAQWWEGFDATPTEMLGGDDHVVVIGRYTGRAKGSGRPSTSRSPTSGSSSTARQCGSTSSPTRAAGPTRSPEHAHDRQPEGDRRNTIRTPR